VCIAKCPDEAFSGYFLQEQGQEKKAKDSMKPFCEPMSDDRWNRNSAKELIQKGFKETNKFLGLGEFTRGRACALGLVNCTWSSLSLYKGPALEKSLHL
jgi:hypothetical protein